MRFLILFLLLLTPPAFAQSLDWKTLGRPLDNDTQQMKDRRVYSNPDTMDKDIAVDQPGISGINVNAWISEHLVQLMTLDGGQFDKQVKLNSQFFTPTGYADYIVYLKNTNLGAFLKTNSYKVTAYVDGTPRITTQGLEQNNGANVYSWQANAILNLSYLDYRNQPPAALYKDAKANNRLLILVNMDLVRIPGQNNGNIIAINHLSFAAPPAVTESLDHTPASE